MYVKREIKKNKEKLKTKLTWVVTSDLVLGETRYDGRKTSLIPTITTQFSRTRYLRSSYFILKKI